MTRRIFRTAGELLAELSITDPSEIDLEAIAQYVSATVLYAPLTGAEATIVGVGDAAVITVNKSSPQARQRFSIGHELGHWMHDAGKLNLGCSSDEMTKKFFGSHREASANRFAADLLLPATMLKPRVRAASPTLAGITGLCQEFKVSFTAAALRVVETDVFPTMVVCSSIAGREWYKASSSVREAGLVPYRHTSKETLAFTALSDPSFRSDMQELDADAWIDDGDAADYVLIESCVKVNAALAVSVLWWKDETQLEQALLDEDGED